MSNGVILAAHGRFAEGLKSGLDLVIGDMPNIKVVNFEEGETFETVDKSLKEAFESLKDCTNILFITDLKGGTPFNRSVMLFGSEPNVRVLSGLNFGLAYQAAFSTTENIDEYLAEVLETGKESMDYFAAPKAVEEDLDEDGI